MPEIPVHFNFDLSDDQAATLADTLGCAPGDVGEILQLYAPAALREYIEMFAGQALTGVSDMRERRLAAILRALPPESFPTDERIAHLGQQGIDPDCPSGEVGRREAAAWKSMVGHPTSVKLSPLTRH